MWEKRSIGGVNSDRKSLVLHSRQNGLVGCLHHVILDGRRIGLWHFKSELVPGTCTACVEGCVWKYLFHAIFIRQQQSILKYVHTHSPIIIHIYLSTKRLFQSHCSIWTFCASLTSFFLLIFSVFLISWHWFFFVTAIRWKRFCWFLLVLSIDVF